MGGIDFSIVIQFLTLFFLAAFFLVTLIFIVTND